MPKTYWEGEYRVATHLRSNRGQSAATIGVSVSCPSVQLDPLETCRSAIAASCWTPDLTAKEVHVGKLSRLFESIAIDRASLDRSLDLIERLREIERLDHGYLAPTTLRRIDMGVELSLVVGAQSTEELRRHFPSICRAGSGRVCTRSEADSLPPQPLFDWLGTDGRTAAEWIKETISHPSGPLAESVIGDGLEAFSIKKSAACNSIRREPLWRSVDSGTECKWKKISLLRQRTGQSTYRFFLGRFANGRIYEGQTLTDPRRAQFGLAALAGEPLTALWREASGEQTIHLPLLLPRSESRLFAALCIEVIGSYGYKWICRTSDICSAIRSALKRLDCEVIDNV